MLKTVAIPQLRIIDRGLTICCIVVSHCVHGVRLLNLLLWIYQIDLDEIRNGAITYWQLTPTQKYSVQIGNQDFSFHKKCTLHRSRCSFKPNCPCMENGKCTNGSTRELTVHAFVLRDLTRQQELNGTICNRSKYKHWKKNFNSFIIFSIFY